MVVTVDPTKSNAIRQLNATIQQLEQQMDDHRASRRPEIVQRLAEEKRMINDPTVGTLTITMLKSKIDFLQEKMKSADKAIEDGVKKFEDLQFYSANVEAKQQELAALTQIMNELKAQLDRTTLNQLAQERITPIDEATLDSPRGDAVHKYVGMAFAGILGFGTVVVGIAFIEFQSRRFNSSQQVNDGLGINVVGELPSVSGRTWRRIKGGQGPAVLKALMAERIDGTRTALIHNTAIESPRVVMVTSADPHEGKTTTSSQLAASLAPAPAIARCWSTPTYAIQACTACSTCRWIRGCRNCCEATPERDGRGAPDAHRQFVAVAGRPLRFASVQALSTSFPGNHDRRAVRAVRLRRHRFRAPS